MLPKELQKLILSYLDQIDLLIAMLKDTYFKPDYKGKFTYQLDYLDDFNQILNPTELVISITSEVHVYKYGNKVINTNDIVKVVYFLMHYYRFDPQLDTIYSNINQALYQYNSIVRIVKRSGTGLSAYDVVIIKI
jgi:hypothetical protein